MASVLLKAPGSFLGKAKGVHSRGVKQWKPAVCEGRPQNSVQGRINADLAPVTARDGILWIELDRHEFSPGKGVTHHCNDQPCGNVWSHAHAVTRHAQAAGPALVVPGDHHHPLLCTGKEEEEEEEAVYELAAPPPSAPAAECDDQGVVTAEEASEDLFEAGGLNSAAEGPSSAPPPAPPPAPGSARSPTHSATSSPPTPSRSTAPPSKPFLSLVKSFSADVEPREGVAVPPTMRHRQLMKTLVKSLSSDSSRADPDPPNPSSSQRAPDDSSKTAPSSPLASSDSRPFFKVQEVEARIEDTRRRLSEAMYKFMGDEGGSRPKTLSSSASELTSLAGFNGHPESNNNNYCIKEEEGGDWEWESPPAKAWSPGAAWGSRSPSLGLDRYSMSALARQDDEEFVELYSDAVDGRRSLPPAPGPAHLRGRRRSEAWNVGHLDIKEPGIFKGWMNEIQSYDPETYHATQTHSVFVRLEGASLRLSKPNRNIARRAAFNEPKPDVTYISQKIYDLTDSNISLVPQNLARKRVWNKKYPICIELGKQEGFLSQTQTGKGGADDDEDSGGGGDGGDVWVERGGKEALRDARAGASFGPRGWHPVPVWKDGEGEGGMVPQDDRGVQTEIRGQEAPEPAWEQERIRSLPTAAATANQGGCPTAAAAAGAAWMSC
ncbi:hypothetical protein SKAU_G00296170 [Synaphobranchus kaupii]|uniref:Uncharacterized protein n=1 Tax=Synaphobranchus kaupii TaxID=118154 RepID=A0A9Q1EUS8_SYNKA|nr:hypothetical protein SKAU_G00296170 [Synaphobranchus kaupii]